MRNAEGEGEISQPRNSPPDSPSPHQSRPTSNTKPDAKLRRRNAPFLIVCKCFSVITALSAILCIAVNILSAFRSFKNGSDVFDGIFRCYAVALAIFVVLAETEWSLIFRFWKVLEYWPGRSMLQIFVAVMTRAFSDFIGKQRDIVLLQSIASYLLLSCGVVYLVSGILCIGVIKRSLEEKEISRDQAVKDLEELEKKRHELEALLIEEENV
ncbi:hypothetical protein SOVF_168980 [Spinacia oleracea]|uniref:Golgi apparatus membrane protein TVP15 n=1 Tax=Spinacia oleracea TaxID=3562 RepID=A0A9R0K7R4_SPIOL|nr:uncharacterized protein LOC110799805 [Spinacia oleracea]KNA07690.1 hypothetical protein SOVF_168980 [Spinacia oleracea]